MFAVINSCTARDWVWVFNPETCQLLWRLRPYPSHPVDISLPRVFRRVESMRP